MRDRRPPATPGPRLRSRPLLCWLGLALTVAGGAGPSASSPTSTTSATPPQTPVLHLKGGGFVAGTFDQTDQPGRLRWRGRGFTGPFDFELKAVDLVRFVAPKTPPIPVGDLRFELSGGDVVFGNLVALDENVVELERPGLGRLRVKRDHLLRIERQREHNEIVYVGPTSLAGWTAFPADDPNAWREEGGALMSEKAGAALYRDVSLPDRAELIVELSWSSTPDFMLALGVNEDQQSVDKAFRFEVWGDELVVQRETDEADLASIAKLDDAAGHLQLKIYLEQKRGRIVVETGDGKPLADLKVADKKPYSLGGVRLENKKGNVRLKRLEVARWNGELLREVRPDGPTLTRRDGTSLAAKGVRYQADTKSFLIPRADDEAAETIVPVADVDRVTLNPLVDAPPRPVIALLQDGSKLSGELLRVTVNALVLTVPGVEEPVLTPIDRLRSVVAHQGKEALAAAREAIPRLEMEDVRLAGQLVPAAEDQAIPGRLTWQPTGSATASPLADGAAGRVIFKEPPPPARARNDGSTLLPNGVRVFNGGGGMIAVQPARPQPVQPQGALQGFLMAFAGASQRPSSTATPGESLSAGRRSLFLRTGDVIPAEVTRIDEQGVSIATDLSKNVVVPHALIKAAELSREFVAPITINKSKRERLLTLPRMQKGSPPTHLIRSKSGDYLRGRVVEMDETSLKVEVRLDVKTIPRDRIARIIWLHAEESESDPANKDPKAPALASAPASAPEPAAEGAQTPARPDPAIRQVQAVRKDGVRLTFVPDRLNEGVLTGKSVVLGDCKVRLDEVDELLIGKAIDKEASQLTFQRWLLTDAPEPKITDEDGADSAGGGGDGATGLSSPLVGKPAPDFSLEQLGEKGKHFRLADAKGQVVMLDFWATWCGPCLQAMPQVEQVAAEFRDRGVKLVAVNLQESPKEITAMLERHKLDLTVALDKDGSVAEKYKANAIPQTVIIDREGNVARLFVGGGPHLGDRLRQALQATLDGPAAAASSDAKKAPADQ